MKLPKKYRHELDSILSHLKRAETYLMRDDVAGIAHSTDNPNGGSYRLMNPSCHEVQAVNVIEKQIGSDLTGLYEAKRRLFNFLSNT